VAFPDIDRDKTAVRALNLKPDLIALVQAFAVPPHDPVRVKADINVPKARDRAPALVR